MPQSPRDRMLETIRRNIERCGHHVTAVAGGEAPRWLYTIGLESRLGYEIVLAGHMVVSTRAAGERINQFLQTPEASRYRLGNPLHPSWTGRLLLGALDYHQTDIVQARQLLPPEDWIDVPDLSQAFSPEREPVWQWLDGGWTYRVAPDSRAVTHLEVMQGYAVSELTRWEEGEWELFSGPGPEVPKDQIVIVPVATLLGFDSSLKPMLDLEIGTGLYREYDERGPGPWQTWRASE